MESKLTIFGGSGFIGSNYVKAYYDAAIGNIASVNARDDKEVYSRDVLYFISTVHNYNVITAPHLDIDTNLSLLIDVLENWRKRPDSKYGVFNFLSSWFIYGAQNRTVSEDSYCDPKGFYSITKRCAEQLLISYCNIYGLKYRILRLANVIGEGDAKVSAHKNALQYVANRLSNNEEVHIDGDGKFHRDYIHVEDCVRAIQLILDKGKSNEIYNIGNGATWPFGQIVQYMKERMKSSSEVVLLNVSVSSFYMNTGKLRALGYVPQYTGEALYAKIADSSSKCAT